MYILWITTQFGAFILALSIHEAAHAFAAWRFGDPTAKHLGRLTLNPMAHADPIGTLIFPAIGMLSGLPLIGWAKPVPVDPYRLKDPKLDHAFIAGAGPLSNLLQAALYTAILWMMEPTAGGLIDSINRGYPNISLLSWAHLWVYMLCMAGIIINLLLAVFNLIPVPPLDGGWILGGVLPDGASRVLQSLAGFGFIIILFLVYAGFFRYIFYPILDKYMTTLMPEQAGMLIGFVFGQVWG